MFVSNVVFVLMIFEDSVINGVGAFDVNVGVYSHVGVDRDVVVFVVILMVLLLLFVLVLLLKIMFLIVVFRLMLVLVFNVSQS